jgi:hydrogenase-4 membrane subunit HyfE
VTGIAQWAGTFALLLALALLCARRIARALHLCALQALLAALAFAARDWEFSAIALAAFVLNGVALPLALQRLAGRGALSPVMVMRHGMVASWLAALALLLGSAAIFAQAAPGGAIAVGSSVVLLGLLLVVQRAHPLVPALGLLASQNGVLLVAAAVPGLPAVTLLAVAVPLVPAMMVANAWLRQ